MIELVWDTELAATVTTRRGGTIGTGDDAPFAPEDLLAAAVATSVMQAFVGAAAEHHLTLLAYLSTAEVLRTKGGGVVLHAYVATAADSSSATLARVGRQALRTSPIAQLLGRRLEAAWHLHALHGV